MFESYREMKDFIQKLDRKPTLLLHSCCAPCSSHVIDLLKDSFELTVFYSNDNISPEEEFEKRLLEEKKFCEHWNIPVLEDIYDASRFQSAICGYEHLKERSLRCYQCYQLRMERTAQKASELHFEFFTTTLSISPYKVSSWINEIGKMLEKKYSVSFLYSDFKKENGYLHSIELSKEYDLYRQDYCGCSYSKQERSEKEHGKN